MEAGDSCHEGRIAKYRTDYIGSHVGGRQERKEMAA
jgi:hypothetical protein